MSMVDNTGEAVDDSPQHLAHSLHHSLSPNFPAAKASTEWPKQSGATELHAAQNRELEKARLQDLVQEFSQQVVDGISVHLVDAETGEVSQATMLMDKYLYTLTLRSVPGDRCFCMRDMSAIYKGPDFMRKVPKLAHLASQCFGLEFATGPAEVNFHFKDVQDRDHFYTCLKILRMSVDIAASKRSGN
eukprot:CAMPEP_0172727840 /NCGR_PEP_ID=MMETSP1074-20121228/91901_1 /TAXON_ID=2916 /ORGANISM="Ceratium fusus, Strain PA161109" /LENGTH=187 /DNA_ID=CAMNT_0013555021 /DNA_START=89 /DNA_END=652 /DNA_ORIENTATION=+